MPKDRRNGVATNSDSRPHHVNVTPSDDTDMDYTCDALFIGTGGVIFVDTEGGETNVRYVVQNGQLLPGRFTRVRFTNTTAANIVAQY